LQAFLADGGNVFFVNIDKRDVVTGAREPAADDTADWTGADNDHAVVHGPSWIA